MSDCPFHKMLSKLRVFAGLPVPVTARWIDGKPDFRQIDPSMWLRSIVERRCAVCDEKLGETSWYIGGEKCVQNHIFNDTAMHKTCALESMRLCPFLNGKREHYRGDDVPSSDLMDTSKRPDRMFLMYAATRNMKAVQRGDEIVAVWAGERLHVEREF